MTFISNEYTKFKIGDRNPHVLVDALHAVSPRGEFFTDEIALQVSQETGCHCIVATQSREVADLNRYPNSTNRAAVAEYRKTIRDLLEQSNTLDGNGGMRFPFLHLSLHGMRNRDYMDVELGTVFGRSCHDHLLQWLFGRFKSWGDNLGNSHRRPIIVENRELFGEPVIADHRLGDRASGYLGYGMRFNTVQIEIASWLRMNHRDELVNLLLSVAEEFRVFAAGNKP